MNSCLLRLTMILPLSSLACITVTYQPRHVVPGDSPFPAIQIEDVTVGERHSVPGLADEAELERTVLWSVRIEAGPRTDIIDMSWSPASAPRCAGGHPALDILLDSTPNHVLADSKQVHWERPVVISGQRIVTGRFHEDRPLLHQPSVVDVRLVHHNAGQANEACVRLTATGPDATYWNQKRWSVGARASFRRSLPFTRSSTLVVGASVGRWVGPVRIGLEGTVGGTDDNDGSGPDPNGPTGTGLCFLAPGPDCDAVNLGSLALETGGVAWRWYRWAIGWSAAYETHFAGMKRLPTGGGPAESRNAISGGPRLGLQLLRVVPQIAGASRFGPTSAWGFELFAAAGQTWEGTVDGSPLTVGVSVLGF